MAAERVARATSLGLDGAPASAELAAGGGGPLPAAGGAALSSAHPGADRDASSAVAAAGSGAEAVATGTTLAAGDLEAQLNVPGTTAAAFNAFQRMPLEQMKGPFAAQQYIQQLIREDPGDAVRICAVPEDQDPAVWQYEHLRQFLIELNALTVALSDTCTKATCPVMKATDEWQYLCAAHKTPKEVSRRPATHDTRELWRGASHVLVACRVQCVRLSPVAVSLLAQQLL